MIRTPALWAMTLLAMALAASAQTRLITMTIAPDMSSRQVSVVVTPNLTHTDKLPTEPLRLARKAMLDDLPVNDADLRALADLNDGLAAQKYVRVLLRQGGGSASDIAYYGTIAVSTGRVWSLPDVVEALHQLDPATEPKDRIRAYAAMLYPHAWAGNALALDAVIDLNGEGKLFGPLSEDTRVRIVAQGDKIGDGRVALRLALVLLQQPKLGDKDTGLLLGYLDRAAASNNLAVMTTAANIIAMRKTETTQTAAKP